MLRAAHACVSHPPRESERDTLSGNGETGMERGGEGRGRGVTYVGDGTGNGWGVRQSGSLGFPVEVSLCSGSPEGRAGSV